MLSKTLWIDKALNMHYFSFQDKNSEKLEKLKKEIHEHPSLNCEFKNWETHLKFIKKHKKDDHVFVSCGGDGSLHHAVNLLMKSKVEDQVKIAYLPDGTGNDFSRSVGLYNSSPKDILTLILENQVVEISIGKIEEHYFSNMISFGWFAEVTPSVDPSTKGILGTWSYYLKALSKLKDKKENKIRFLIDGKESKFSDVLGFFVGNSKYAGGGVKITPKAKLYDPWLDLLIVKNMETTKLLSLAVELQKENPQLQDYSVEYLKFNKLKFHSKEEIQASIDGEPKKFKSATVKLSKQKIKIFLP